ncbi:MAG: cyclic nucleotide-binding domain-containing protein [Pirellulales bacterium]|nr:cyclic nucleotide-binding domain-containing protein [Pirellulales bacterium]
MSPMLSAFLIGLVAACSLPLGAITSRFWQPGGRTIAFLMSFGGGALLAALTIDLAGPALAKGHFYPLAIGCITGGLLFVILNQIVNDHGGFLRKAATTVTYLRGQRRKRHRRFIENMCRLDVFRDLPHQDLRELADSAVSQSIRAGTTIFRAGDPGRYLFIVENGEIELFDPDSPGDSKMLRRNDAFGHMALFTNRPHAKSALAKTNCEVLMLSRDRLSQVLKTSHALRQTTDHFLRSDEVTAYLRDVQGISRDETRAWAEAAGRNCRDRGSLYTDSDIDAADRFCEIAREIRRVPFFELLPLAEVQHIASRVFLKHHKQGHTFFHRDEEAERMYIVDRGEAALLNAGDDRRAAERIADREAFGTLSFITGTRHAATAVAAADTSVWVLRRVDFDELLERCPHLSLAVQDFLKNERVSSYLHEKHHVDLDNAATWVRRAIRSMDLGKLIPSANELSAAVGPKHGAPLAIWLGILLDGVPESLVIGSSMLHKSVSLSLIAGLFLSNYPEALSSSVGMRQQGIPFSRILLMWTSLMLITGVGAALGNLFFREAPEVLFSLVEGIAAGAMLTMIAETMLPEAYFKGGSIVGFSTLLGFLAAIFFKTLG